MTNEFLLKNGKDKIQCLLYRNALIERLFKLDYKDDNLADAITLQLGKALGIYETICVLGDISFLDIQSEAIAQANSDIDSIDLSYAHTIQSILLLLTRTNTY